MTRVHGIIFAACLWGTCLNPAHAETPTGAPAVSITDAERISQLRRKIEADQKRLDELKAAWGDPEGEYSRAESDFQKADARLEQQKRALQALKGQGKADRARALDAEVRAFSKTWQLAKDRFELAIEERKTLKEEIAALEQTLGHDREALTRLTDPTPTEPPALPDLPAPAPSQPAETAASPVVPTPLNAIKAGKGEPASSSGPPAEKKPESKELLQAEADEKVKAEAAREAEKEARSINERIADLDRDIRLERTLLATARRKVENAEATHRARTDDFHARSTSGTPPETLKDLSRQVRESEVRVREATAEVRKRSETVDDLQSERAELLAQQNAALTKARGAEETLKAAEDAVHRLENPFTLHNVLHWIYEHGPKILLILIMMAALQWLSNVFTARIVKLMSRGGSRQGTRAEREDRASTLVGVFHNAASVAIVAGGVLMIFQTIGVPIAPLMGGAAVVGLAVAFGAQNLIRDYFYGFVILLEQQYKLNDVVKIGAISGQVEQITLRMTVLRDLEGHVHFMPNGNITSVTNMTHGWSRALFDIPVDYKEDVDRVMAMLVELGKAMRDDPQFQADILDDPTMLGVDALGDSGVTIRFFIKTRTSRQWPIKRELLRRIKNKFDELGIEIPFPHRVVYHRSEGREAPPEPLPTHPRVWSGRERPRA